MTNTLKIVKARNDEFNRKMLEQGGFDVLLSPEVGERKDSLRQIDSGFNHVFAHIAARKGISLGIDCHNLRTLKKKEKAIRLAKIRQNIAICKKAKVTVQALNYKDARNAKSLLLVLGAATQTISF
ncbi:hypothetical protein KW805_01275 [Candidatus Pacearchaeota archaeon]|nr:hypothetical protein [Candidatus Pacearchaeota archaeon]